jgi:alpha-L-rhamnosidase
MSMSIFGSKSKGNFRHLIRFAILLTCFIGCASGLAKAAEVTNLQVEYSNTPLGIDVARPRFGWQMRAPEGGRGYSQSAYRIVLNNPGGAVMWDSGKVSSGSSAAIPYAGNALQATTRYNWSVTVWDQNGDIASERSWFETGLMNPALSAWDGAQWIGGSSDDLVLYSHYLSVFKVEYDVGLDQASGSTRAGLVVGANDHRLLNKNMNIYGIESAYNGSYVKFEIDISRVDGSEAGLAKFNIYRAGYHPDDQAVKPLQSIEIPATLISSENKYEPHHVGIESVFGTLTIYVGGTESKNKIGNVQRSPFGGGGININPIGSGGDYIGFPMLADIGFAMDAGQKAAFSDIAVRNYRKPSNILFTEELSSPAYRGIYSDHAEDTGSGLLIKDNLYYLNGGDNGLLSGLCMETFSPFPPIVHSATNAWGGPVIFRYLAEHRLIWLMLINF